jgi:carbamoyl-phosphate synthase large subunit
MLAIERGLSVEEVASITKIDPWFLRQFEEMSAVNKQLAAVNVDTVPADLLREAKRVGAGDEQLALLWKTTPDAVRQRRAQLNIAPVFKRVDTCAAEFESFTPYM